MTKRKLSVSVRYYASWSETISVEVPDLCTEKEAEEIVNRRLERAAEEAMPQDIEIDTWNWDGQPEFSPASPLAFPTDSSLIVERQGHRWATNGIIAIREDVSTPVDEEPWIAKGENLTNLLGRVVFTLEKPLALRFQEKYAPILRSGLAVKAKIDQNVLCAVLHEDGQMKALVMPYNGSVKAVDYLGNPCTP